MGSWEIKRLDEVVSFASGGTPSKAKADYWVGNIPWISATTMHQQEIRSSDLFISEDGLKAGSKLAKAGDLLLLVRGSMLWKKIPICICMKDVAFNQDVKSIKTNDNLMSEFLLYWFLSHEKNLLHKVVGTGIGAGKLDFDSVKSLLIPVPPLSEQKQIVSILEQWDAAIEKTEALIDAKERQFGWLCQKFFTPNNDLTSSWQRRKIGDFVKQRKEKSQPTEEIPLYSLTIENGVTAKTDRYNREFLVKDKGNKTYKVVHPNDIVFNPANLRWGAIARSEVKHKVVLSPIYEVYKIRDEKINADFLKYALTCKRQVGVFATKTEGTLIERMAVKADVFELCEISVPQDKEQQKNIAHTLNTAQQEITLLKKLADQYRTQKRGLMQKLLSGKWHIKNKGAA